MSGLQGPTEVDRPGIEPAINLSAAVINSLQMQVAVLDAQGVIVGATRSWRDVARESEGDENGYIGVNYLEVCRRAAATEPEAARVEQGLRDVLEGKADSFGHEYPCQRPSGLHWFHMTVTPLPARHGGATVVHEDITERRNAIEAREREHQLLRTVLNTSASAIVVYDGDGFVRMVSRSAAELIGLSASELEGTDFADAIWPIADPDGNPLPVEQRPAARVLRERQPLSDVRVSVLSPVWGRRQILVNLSPVLDRDGAVELIIATVRDITEQLEAEAALKRRLEVEALLSDISRLFNRSASRELEPAVNDAISMLGRFLGVDRVSIFVYGEGIRLLTQTHEWCREGVAPRRTAMQNRPTAEFKWGLSKLQRGEHMVVEDIESLPGEAAAELQHWRQTQVRATVAVPVAVNDRLLGALGLDSAQTPRQWSEEDLFILTSLAQILGHALERKRIEEQAWTERNLNAAILDSAGTLVCVLDTDMRIIRFNRACERVTGYRLSEVRGRRFDDLLLPSDEQSGVLHVLSEAVEGRFPNTNENDWIARDGQRRRIRWYNNAIFGDQGKVAYVVGIGVEITGQRRAEAALRQRLDVENLLTGISGRFNRLSPEEISRGIDQSLAEISRFVDADHGCVLIHARKRQALSMQHEWAKPGSRPITAHSQHMKLDHDSAFPQRLAAKQPWLLLKSDIEQAQDHPLAGLMSRLNADAVFVAPMIVAEKVLGCLCLSFRQTQTARACDGLMLASAAMAVAYAIERMEVDAALRASERRQRVLLSGMPDPIYRLSREGEVLDIEAEQHPGMLVPPEAMIGRNIAQVLGGDAGLVIKTAIFEALNVRQPVGLTYGIRTPHGEYVFETRLLATGPDEVLAIERDITEQRRAEEDARLRRQELTQVSRLATVGEMAAGLAHEMNQPLAAIVNYARGSLRVLEQNGNKPDRLLMPLQQIAQQAERAARVIQNIRRFVARHEVRREDTDINQVVRRAIDFVQSDTQSGNTVIVTNLLPHMPLVQLDAVLIEQVVVNLLLNAMDAMRDAQVQLRQIDVTTRRDDTQIYLSVSDTGPGVEDDNVAKLFDPFFTTKSDGLGLGLAISKSIIESHQGRIWVESSSSPGACFTCALPLDEPEAFTPPADAEGEGAVNST